MFLNYEISLKQKDPSNKYMDVLSHLKCSMYKNTLPVKVPSVADVFEFGNFRNR